MWASMFGLELDKCGLRAPSQSLVRMPAISGIRKEIYFHAWRSCWLASDYRLERAATREAWMATTSGQVGRNLSVRSAAGLAGLGFLLRNVKRALGGSAGSC